MEYYKTKRIPQQPAMQRLAFDDCVQDRLRTLLVTAVRCDSTITVRSLQLQMKQSLIGRILTLCVVNPMPTQMFEALREQWLNIDSALFSNLFASFFKNACYHNVGRNIFNWAYMSRDTRLMSSLVEQAQIILSDEDEEVTGEQHLAMSCFSSLDLDEMRWFLFESGNMDEFICDGTLDPALIHKEMLKGPAAVAAVIDNIICEHPTFHKVIFDNRPKITMTFEKETAVTVAAFKAKVSSACRSSMACMAAAAAASNPPSVNKDIECKICCEPFDDDDHRPLMLLTCGHGACRKCIDEIMERTGLCPTCRVQMEPNAMITNFMLMEYLRK